MKKRLVQPSDLLKIKFLSRPAFSPLRDKIAYVLSSANLEKNGYDSCLWIFDLNDVSDRRLTFTNSEKFFAWEENDIVFASSASLAKGKTAFYKLNLETQKTCELFTTDKPVSDIVPLGSGRYLLKAVYDKEYPNPEGADYLVFEQIPFMANGRGFIGQKRTALAVYDVSTKTLTRITTENTEVERFRVSADKTKVLFIAAEFSDVRPTKNHVYEYNMKDGKTVCKSEGLDFSFKSADYFADGILVVGTDQKRIGVTQNVSFFMLDEHQLKCLNTNYASSMSGAIGCDCRYNSIDQSQSFFIDGTKAIFCSMDGFIGHIHSIDTEGKVEQITHKLSSIDNYDWKNGKAAVVGLRGLQLQELYLVENGQEVQLTHHNDALISELTLSVPQYFKVDNSEGLMLDGWYMKPAGYEEGKKYPTILHIHGGPKSAFGDNYFHEMQCWAAQGWGVIFTNPRGSDGRENDFDDIRGYYGVKDYNDLMAFTDWCVNNLPFVDEKRLGVTGGSYGGYMTNWIVTQTHRFKAAVAQRPISNWVSKYGCCDIGYYYVEDQHLGRPWENPEQAWQESPLKYAGNAKTPLLLIQSNEDFRCERDQSFQMFTAMKRIGVECRMCLFNGDNHELSRSGHPRNRLARLREIIEWFKGHLS